MADQPHRACHASTYTQKRSRPVSACIGGFYSREHNFQPSTARAAPTMNATANMSDTKINKLELVSTYGAAHRLALYVGCEGGSVSIWGDFRQMRSLRNAIQKGLEKAASEAGVEVDKL